MTVRQIRLAAFVVIGLLAVVAALAARPAVLTEAQQDEIDARISDAQLDEAAANQPPPVIVTRGGAIRCLRGAGFTVHSAPERGFEVTGRGLPTGTVVRILGPGAPAQTPADPGWSATAQAVFTMSQFNDQTVRRAFFGCIDPPGSFRITR